MDEHFYVDFVFEIFLLLQICFDSFHTDKTMTEIIWNHFCRC